MFEMVGLTLMDKVLHELGDLRRDIQTLIAKDTKMDIDVTQFQADLDAVQQGVNDLGTAVGDIATSVGNIPGRIATAIQAAKDAQKAADTAAFGAAMTELEGIAATAKAASTAAAAAKAAADAIEVPAPVPATPVVTLVGPAGETATVSIAVGGMAALAGASSDGAKLTYTSDDPTIATVDANSGVVTAVAVGSTAIEAANPTGQKVSLGITVH